MPYGLQIVVISDADAVLVERIDLGARCGQQDRRVGGDHELRAGLGGACHHREERERSGDRQRCLRLVEQVETVNAESVGGQSQERLAVRLSVEGTSPYNDRSGANRPPLSMDSATL